MTSMLWQIMRSLSPLSLDHDFRHLHLFAHLDDQLCTSDGCLLHTLCLSLMRAAATTSSTWSPFCAAFPDSYTTVSVVFPVMKELEMERTLQNVLTSFCELRVDSTADDEFGSGLAMENALLCGLTAALVRDGWTVLEGNLAVHGVITEWLAGTPTEAVAFAVHTGPNDCIDFLLSPDVIRFRPFKIGRFLIGPLKRLFDDGGVVILDNYLETLSPDDIQEMKCLVLPSMKEGLVSGCCKLVPKDCSLSKHREIWTEKASCTGTQKRVVFSNKKHQFDEAAL